MSAATKPRKRTRKQAVLEVLQRAAGHPDETLHFGDGEIVLRASGGWVEGWVLHHPLTGGSEGLRRVRELRAEGHEIEMRAHPDKNRDSRQYRLVQTATPFAGRPDTEERTLFEGFDA